MQTEQAGWQNWHDQLETIGADLFLRYRKRLDEPGILWTMREEQPDLSILDLWVRLQAGRRLVAESNDFRALVMIRSGEWQRLLRHHRAERTGERRGDRVSRVLVMLGEALVMLFGLLILSAWLPADNWRWIAIALPLVAYLAWRVRWARAAPPPGVGHSAGWPPQVVR